MGEILPKEPTTGLRPVLGNWSDKRGLPMRCYFHLVNNHETIPDDTGIEVSDLDAMHYQALQAIQELRQEVKQVHEGWQGWRLDVVCPAGSLLLSVPLETTLQ